VLHKDKGAQVLDNIFDIFFLVTYNYILYQEKRDMIVVRVENKDYLTPSI